MLFELNACIKLNNTRIKIKLTWSTRSFNSHCFTIVWILVRLITEQLKPSVNTTVIAINIKKKLSLLFVLDPFAVIELFKGTENDYAFIIFFLTFYHNIHFVFNRTQCNLQVLGSLTPLTAGLENISLKHCAYLYNFWICFYFDILVGLKNSPRLVKRLLDENVENDLRLWPTMSTSYKNSTVRKDMSIALTEQIFDS